MENITIRSYPAILNTNTLKSISETRKNIENALSSDDILAEDENNY